VAVTCIRRDIEVDGACGLRGGAVGEPRVARAYGSGYATNERIPSCYLQFHTSYLRRLSPECTRQASFLLARLHRKHSELIGGVQPTIGRSY